MTSTTFAEVPDGGVFSERGVQYVKRGDYARKVDGRRMQVWPSSAVVQVSK